MTHPSTTVPSSSHGAKDALLAGVPTALAIGIFGTLFGAAAVPLMGVPLTVLASVLIFSGAVQLALVGLLLGGAPALALLSVTMLLNLRNVLLGATLRPHLPSSRWRRAALAWFFIDEKVGLALARPSQASQTIAQAGALCYGAWIVGTVIGIRAGTAAGLQALAGAIFPVLFIGLAAVATTGRGPLVRLFGAVAMTLTVATLAPWARGLAPVLAALLVTLPERRA